MSDVSVETGRHSLAHVLAKAVTELYDGVKLAIGPAIDTGFYYDFDIPVSISDADFEKIEAKMTEILGRREPFVRKELSSSDALALFKDEPYKLELIAGLEGQDISVYWLGDDFVDLCRGPHVENAIELRSWSFKVASVAGAYWRGDENNAMLQRIYVYAYPTKAELKERLTFIEEAKRRDHRKLGRELDLFALYEEGPGFPFFLPKGMIIKNELLSFWRDLHYRLGYQEISTPIILNEELWHRSGHWDHYKENMYFTKIDDGDYAIKPMNCPGGMLAYKRRMWSYKDLPLRIAELGLVHRHELSGALHGLMRVRCFTQDDAHIYMTPEQVGAEITGVIDKIGYIYSVFGFEYRVELSTRPEDFMGEIETWNVAEKALEDALIAKNVEYSLNPGDGAFYGPKIDFHLKDSIGRTWQCGTIQLDFQMPERFELEYVGADGERHRPIMLHTAAFGSIERFIGILIEHFAGKFPFWFSALQVGVVPVREEHTDYAQQIAEKLRLNKIRARVDTSDGTMGNKIKAFRNEMVPYILIVGDEEQNAGTISLRTRSGKQINGIPLDSFLAACAKMTAEHSLELIEDLG